MTKHIPKCVHVVSVCVVDMTGVGLSQVDFGTFFTYILFVLNRK